MGLDFTRSNELEIMDDLLTGRVLGPIIDQHAKRDTVAEVCRQIGCTHAQVIAVGDGANDLEMMKLAGLSVAYHAIALASTPTPRRETACASNKLGRRPGVPNAIRSPSLPSFTARSSRFRHAGQTGQGHGQFAFVVVLVG